MDVQRYHESFLDSLARQTQWVEGRGVLLILAMYCSVIGSATFVLGMGLHVPLALVVGWPVAVVGGSSLHLAFLGRPERFWRALTRPHSSWLSRGIWSLGAFAAVGGVYVGPYVLTSATPARGGGFYWAVLVVTSCLLVYDGFLLRAAGGVRIWSSWTMPLLFPIFGLLAGSAILTVVQWAGSLPSDEVTLLGDLLEGLLLAGALLLGLTLVQAWRSPASRASVLHLTRGAGEMWFWLGVVLLTIVSPAGIAVAGHVTHVPLALLGTAAVLAIVGEFAFKYSVLGSGIYASQYPPEAEAAALQSMASWERVG